VANLTRRDGEEFFEIASQFRIKTETQIFSLEEADVALDRFRTGELRGTAVLKIA
jgi:propanol-preferring alcohol dehydrogenase